MLGDLDAEPAAVLADAIAHARTSLEQIQEYLANPNRHPGGTNETSRELAADREKVFASAAEVVPVLLSKCSVLLDCGRQEAAAIVLVHAQACLMDALGGFLAVSAYETLRVDTEAEARTADEEAQRRSDNAAKGAPEPSFSDDELTEFMRAFELKNSRRHGAIKAAGHHFDVTEAAIRKRLKKIRTG